MSRTFLFFSKLFKTFFPALSGSACASLARLANIPPKTAIVNCFFSFFYTFFAGTKYCGMIREILHHMYTEPISYPRPRPKKDPEYRGPISSFALDAVFSSCGDFESRLLDFGLEGRVAVRACWLDGLVSGADAADEILRPLTDRLRAGEADGEAAVIERILAGGVYRGAVHRRSDMDLLVSDLCHGYLALIFDGSAVALSFEIRSADVRAVGEPTLEKSLKGGKDAFTETLRTNTALVRRRIASPKLKLAESTLGRRSNTRLSVLFMEGLVSPDTLRELARRLDKLDVDALLSLGSLEEAIVDAPLSPFPQLLHTERPDRFAMYLIQGRIGLLVDGLPVGLVLPVTLAEFMKVTDDAGSHFLVSSALSLMRWTALAVAALLPAFYVAVAMYHQEMIPTRLLLSIIEAEQDVPFSTALEVLGMLAAFCLVQEAGLRLPNPIGDTVSIIGALIVGQAAVEAKIVSPIAIIVVAFSAIACYALPSQDLAAAVRLARFLLLLGAIFAGLYGTALIAALLLLHLASLDSFGVDYTAPLSDGLRGGLRRLLFLPPQPAEKFRDPHLNTPDRRKQK